MTGSPVAPPFSTVHLESHGGCGAACVTRSGDVDAFLAAVIAPFETWQILPHETEQPMYSGRNCPFPATSTSRRSLMLHNTGWPPPLDVCLTEFG
jgi:hypothetical protein